jgi:hypothetical protein
MCIWFLIAYQNLEEAGTDAEELFLLDSFYFLSNNETHFDYDNKKIYFGGNFIYDNPDP